MSNELEQRANREKSALEQRRNKGIEQRGNSENNCNEVRANYEKIAIEARANREEIEPKRRESGEDFSLNRRGTGGDLALNSRGTRETLPMKPRGSREEFLSLEDTKSRGSREVVTNEQLVEQIQAGENVTENMLQLYKQNKGLIYKIANKYKGVAELDDLLQEGYFGLCKAVQHYDADTGVLFMSYAPHWIQQTMSRYVKSNGSVRIPEHAQILQRKIKKMEARYLAEYGRKPTNEEICDFLDISEEVLENAKLDKRMFQIGSLDVPIGEEEDMTMHELLPSGEDLEEDILEQVQQEQLGNVIWSIVDALPDEEPEIIRLRFKERLTLEETGERIGLGTNRVKTLENKAFREMRKPSNSDRLRPFLDEEIRHRALQGNGVKRFDLTWTSSTESAALYFAEMKQWAYEQTHKKQVKLRG